MRPKPLSDFTDFAARLAMEEDRRAEARATAGLDIVRPGGEGRSADHRPRRHGPVHHGIPDDVSEYVVPDFRPGIDSCSIALRSSAVEVMHWQGPGGTVLCVDDGNDRLVVAFLGLETPPFDDITLVHPPNRGRDRTRFDARPLTDLNIAKGPVVTTSLAAPSGSRALAEFWAFDADSEVVEIMRSFDAAGEADVAVMPTPDGRDALVVVDGHAAAILRGAPDATGRNVRVIVSPDI